MSTFILDKVAEASLSTREPALGVRPQQIPLSDILEGAFKQEAYVQ